MPGIYLPLTKFILIANQLTVNLTKENGNAVVFDANGRGVPAEISQRELPPQPPPPAIDYSDFADVRDGVRMRPPDAIYIQEDEAFWNQNYPFDSGGGAGYVDYGTIPQQFECYSCMSLSYQDNWERLQFMYTTPKIFTNRCNDPFMERNIPTVLCGSFCASLLEPVVDAGVFMGYKYIRGCVDRILRHGFNQTALRTHRFNQVDQCRSLPRAHLFNPPRGLEVPIFGDVQLCSCYGDKCNGASTAAPALHHLLNGWLMGVTVCLSLLQLPQQLWFAHR